MSEPPRLSSSGSDLESRISEVLDLYPSRSSAARASGKSTDMLAAYARGSSHPPFEALVALAAGAGVRLDWLATGQGPMRHDQTPAATATPATPDAPPAAQGAAPAALDGALLGLCLEGLKRVYSDVNARIDDRSAGVMAAKLYDDVITASAGEPDPESARRIALRLALQQLRRDLLAPGDAASRKHSG